MNIPIITRLQEARVDREGCLVEGIILSSGLSENGTYYSPEVVDSSGKIFEGVQCYADHPGPGETERSVRDVVGAIESAWSDDGRLRATIRLSRAHDWLLTMIGEGLVGDLSINALGKTRVGRRDGRVVREVLEITKAMSVDFVARAAAGGHVDRIVRESAGYRESLKLLENLTVKELTEARPDLVDSISEKVREESKVSDEVRTEELEKLQVEVDNRRTALQREMTVSTLIEKSGLPKESRKYLTREAMMIDPESEDKFEEMTEALIDRHRRYIASLSDEGHIRGMGSSKDRNAKEMSAGKSTLRMMGF